MVDGSAAVPLVGVAAVGLSSSLLSCVAASATAGTAAVDVSSGLILDSVMMVGVCKYLGWTLDD